MADTPQIQQQDVLNTYQMITAITIAELTGMDFKTMSKALKSELNNLLKLELESSKGAVEMNRRVEVMKSDREALTQFVDNLLLSLTEIKNIQVKNLTEDQIQERDSTIRMLDKDLTNVKKETKELSERITYIYDLNEDNQKRFREKVTRSIKKIDQFNTELMDIIMKHLGSLEIDIKEKDVFLKDLKSLLNDPDLQSMYLNEASDKTQKGFTQKLKGWMSSGESNPNTQIIEVLSALLAKSQGGKEETYVRTLKNLEPLLQNHTGSIISEYKIILKVSNDLKSGSQSIEERVVRVSGQIIKAINLANDIRNREAFVMGPANFSLAPTIKSHVNPTTSSH